MSRASTDRPHHPTVGMAGTAQSTHIGSETGRNLLCLVQASPALRVLSEREWQCLQWCANGKSYWESGKILNISRRTVSFHMEAVRAKLGACTNAQAVAIAFRAGLLHR